MVAGSDRNAESHVGRKPKGLNETIARFFGGEIWSRPGESLKPYYAELFGQATTTIDLASNDPDIAILVKRHAESGIRVRVINDQQSGQINLREKLPDEVQIHEGNLNRGFAVIDGHHTILEEPTENPRATIRLSQPRWGRFLTARFESSLDDR